MFPITDVLQKVIEKCVAGAVVLDLCKFGDESLETGTAGCYNSKKKDDKERIKKGRYITVCRLMQFTKLTQTLREH